VTYAQLDSNIRVLYVFLFFFKNTAQNTYASLFCTFLRSEGETVATIGGKMDSMNRMRMQSSPRPASGRQVVVGKQTRPDETKNCVRKLMKKEISRAGNLAFNRTNSQEKFRNFHLQVCMCVCVCCIDPCHRNHLQTVTSWVVLIFTRLSGFRGVFQQ